MTKKKAVFTISAGRHIHAHGEPFVSVGREGGTAAWDADSAARLIVRLLNASPTGRALAKNSRR